MSALVYFSVVQHVTRPFEPKKKKVIHELRICDFDTDRVLFHRSFDTERDAIQARRLLEDLANSAEAFGYEPPRR